MDFGAILELWLVLYGFGRQGQRVAPEPAVSEPECRFQITN